MILLIMVKASFEMILLKIHEGERPDGSDDNNQNERKHKKMNIK